jgi:hypothetical protein
MRAVHPKQNEEGQHWYRQWSVDARSTIHMGRLRETCVRLTCVELSDVNNPLSSMRSALIMKEGQRWELLMI